MIEMLGGSVVPPSNFQFVATIVADNQPFTIIFPRPRGGAYAHPREGIIKTIETMSNKQLEIGTRVLRHCRDCDYYEKQWQKSRIGWCYWLGRYCVGSSYECEDGFKERL